MLALIPQNIFLSIFLRKGIVDQQFFGIKTFYGQGSYSASKNNNKEISTNESTAGYTEDIIMIALETPECVNLQEVNETINLNGKISSLKSPLQPCQ